MSLMIKRGGELFRVSPKNSKDIEYSTDNGRYWKQKSVDVGRAGRFYCLLDNGSELLALTDDGVYYSTDEGRYWKKRSV